jgi:prepilin-type N-terminal cleavage/methylation domain-containing protein
MILTCSRPERRRGFTLIELLVVLGIILLIVALGYFVFPRYADRKMQYAADRLQGWLLNAKMQAKRDGRPTGLRIQFNSTNTATSLVYIQQPDDFTPLNSTCSGPVNTTVTFLPLTALIGASQLADQAPVEAGDYIEFYGVGPVYQISQVSLALTGNTITLLTTGPDTGTSTPFRIRRAPRLQPGEEDLTLPDDVVLDLRGLNANNPVTAISGINPPRSRVPMRTVGGNTVYEILFSPAGNVIGSGTGQTNINLWLTDTNDVNNADNRALLITVQVGSGLIGVNSVAPGDPYAFTKDGRASGM